MVCSLKNALGVCKSDRICGPKAWLVELMVVSDTQCRWSPHARIHRLDDAQDQITLGIAAMYRLSQP